MGGINVLSRGSTQGKIGVVSLIRGPFISVKGSINNEPTLLYRWIGLWPAIIDDHIEYMAEVFKDMLKDPLA